MFRDHNAAHYNIDSNASPTETAQKRARIEDYLSSAGFPSLSPEQRVDLDLPISPTAL